jgi:signal transduction histidine kinase
MKHGRISSSFDHPQPLVRVPLLLMLSIAAAAAALWVVGVLEPVVGVPVLFPSFVGIVFLSSNVAGTRWGIVTMAAFAVGFSFLYQEPRGAFRWHDARPFVLLSTYAVTGFLVARIGGELRKAYARVREEHRAAAALHEQREDLVRTLAHDVRSPLSIITMNAALLARETESSPAVRRRAQAIEKSAASVVGMLGDLVEMARLESGHLRLDRRPVDLAGFVLDLQAHLAGTLPLDRVQVTVPAGLPAADVDPQRLERILVNLLSNALKYAPAPTPVVLGASVQDGQLVVSVADRGPGIAPRDLPHLFEKYFRAGGSPKKEGIGLGLYATRLLVQVHGGRIWVESALGEGTTFYVALPPATHAAERVPKEAQGPSDAARGGAVPGPRARTSVPRLRPVPARHPWD